MNRIFFIVAIGLALLSACKDEMDKEKEAATITTITASVPSDDGSELKLSLGGTNKNEVRWSEGDRIYFAEVLGNVLSAEYGLSAFVATAVHAGGKTATFEMVAGEKPLNIGKQYMAFHLDAFDEARTVINSSGAVQHTPVVTLMQMIAEDFRESDDELFFPTTAVTVQATGATFAFRHVMALIEFDIWTDDVSLHAFELDKVSIEASSGEQFFATSLTCNADGTVVAATSASSLEISLRNGDATSRYTLSATPRKVRLPVMWNPDATTPSGEFAITLHPAAETETPMTFTLPARILRAGVIYRMSMQITVPAIKTVAVAAQDGTINAGTAGETTFAVTTDNIADGASGTIEWYSDEDGIYVAGEPEGITSSVSNVASNDATVTMTATAKAAAGSYHFRVFFDGIASDVATLTVTKVPVTGVSLNKTTMMLFIDMYMFETLIATVFPENATNKTVTWESDNPSIVSVNPVTGYVKLEPDAMAGYVTITARSEDGDHTATCIVQVMEPPEPFEVENIYYKYAQGTSGVKVTNKNYSDSWSDGNSNSYSGDVTIPETVTHNGVTYHVTMIGWGAFWGSESLSSVTLHSGIECIEIRAFNGCTLLETLTLHEGLKEIRSDAFSGCESLETLHLPASLISIDNNNSNTVFEGCSKLSLTVAEGNTTFSVDKDGVLFQSRNTNPLNSLRWIPEKLTGEYVIPDETVEIRFNAITYSNLTKISVPASITILSAHNFRFCRSLTDVTLNWTNPASVIMESNPKSFYFVGSTYSDITLHVPAGTKDVYEEHELWGAGFVIVEE